MGCFKRRYKHLLWGVGAGGEQAFPGDSDVKDESFLAVSDWHHCWLALCWELGSGWLPPFHQRSGWNVCPAPFILREQALRGQGLAQGDSHRRGADAHEIGLLPSRAGSPGCRLQLQPWVRGSPGPRTGPSFTWDIHTGEEVLPFKRARKPQCWSRCGLQQQLGKNNSSSPLRSPL